MRRGARAEFGRHVRGAGAQGRSGGRARRAWPGTAPPTGWGRRAGGRRVFFPSLCVCPCAALSRDVTGLRVSFPHKDTRSPRCSGTSSPPPPPRRPSPSAGHTRDRRRRRRRSGVSDRGGELGRAAGRARSACTARLHVGPRPLPADRGGSHPRESAPRHPQLGALRVGAWPWRLFSLLFPLTSGVGCETTRRVFSARDTPRFRGARRWRCTIARTFPRHAGHKDFGVRSPPDPRGFVVGGVR